MKLHGSAHAGACRKTGQLHAAADGTLPIWIIEDAPFTTSAKRSDPEGTVIGCMSFIVTHVNDDDTDTELVDELEPATSASGTNGLSALVLCRPTVSAPW